MRDGEKFAAENKILRKEIENLRKTIFEKKRKKKREKALNFYEKDEMKNQILFFSPAKIARARELAAALEEIESDRPCHLPRKHLMFFHVSIFVFF
jgi:hypothetical protein